MKNVNKNLSLPPDWEAAIESAACEADVNFSHYVLLACAALMTDEQKLNLSSLNSRPGPGRPPKRMPPVGKAPV